MPAVLKVIEQERPEAEQDLRQSGTVRVFQVYTDGPPHDPVAARSAVDPITSVKIPLRGEAHPDYSYMRVERVRVTRDPDSNTLYTVVVFYSSRVLEGFQDPLNQPAEYEWSYIGVTEVLDYAFHPDTGVRVPLVNTAGEPFLEMPEREDFRIMLTVTRNEATFTASTQLTYTNKTNSTIFFNAQPGQAKCIGIPARRLVNDFSGGFYWQVRYEFQFSANGFGIWVADRGTYYRDGTIPPPADNRRRFQDSAGIVLEQGNLNGAGGKLAEGQAVVFLPFTQYLRVDFGPLGLEG